VGVTVFGATTLYNIVKREALIQVNKGLLSTYQFSQALTGTKFEWEQ